MASMTVRANRERRVMAGGFPLSGPGGFAQDDDGRVEHLTTEVGPEDREDAKGVRDAARRQPCAAAFTG
ncbi:ferredoxin [Streptomyces sp. NPDC051985]|uniref:ferredoxin n=1 Tax=Streptomyces sp. NPDC051985 TaxID=3155807 RepID=UPI00342D75E6